VTGVYGHQSVHWVVSENTTSEDGSAVSKTTARAVSVVNCHYAGCRTPPHVRIGLFGTDCSAGRTTGYGAQFSAKNSPELAVTRVQWLRI
jgi:hypothetical protein